MKDDPNERGHFKAGNQPTLLLNICSESQNNNLSKENQDKLNRSLLEYLQSGSLRRLVQFSFAQLSPTLFKSFFI
jgi:hypothetical protein